MTRIVQIAGFYGPRSGGLRTCVDALGRGYIGRGHERALITPGPAAADQRGPTGRHIVRRGPILPRSGGYRVLLPGPGLLSTLDALEPDRLEISDKLLAPTLGAWAARNRVPSVVISHERLDHILAPRVPGQFATQPVTDRWNNRIAARCDTIVAASAYAAEEFERIGAPVRLIPLGVDLDAFRPQWRDPGGMCQVVCVGRLSAEKRPELAIDTVATAVERGADIRLTMVGAGPLQALLEHRAHGLPVTFTGHLADRDQVAEIVADADVALSCSGIETFGLAVVEAMACATPAVIADGGGARELAAEHAALVVPPEPGAMADAVVALHRDPVAGSAARANAERFPWTATIDQFLDAHRAARHPAPC